MFLMTVQIDHICQAPKRHPHDMIFSTKQKEMLNQMHNKADREQGLSSTKNEK